MADFENEVNSAGEINLGDTEAETLILSGAYVVESNSGPEISGGALIKSTGTGTATGTYMGPTGTYWLDVTWINESDGASTFAALVNGIEVGSWTGAGGNTSGEPEVERIAVSLTTGDRITLSGIKDAGEPARIDFITISDQSGNTDPSAQDDAFSVEAGSSLNITELSILANDSDLDGDPLTVSNVLVGPTDGSLSWSPGGPFTYTPDSNFTGQDSFTYEVSDGNGGTAQATVTITVEDPDAIEGALIDVGDTEAESLDLAGAYSVEPTSDPEVSGGAMIKSTGTGTATGTFVGAEGTYWLDVTWINENDGVAQFTVLVNNVPVQTWTGAGGSTSGESVVERIAVSLDYGDVITLRGVKNAGEPARIDFISISDKSGNTDPTAGDDAFSTSIGTQLDISAPGILDNDSDLDGDSLSVSQIISSTSNGGLIWNADGSFTYTPNSAFIGADSFTYEVIDENGGTAQATVTITVEDPSAVEGALIYLGDTEAESLDLAGAYGVEPTSDPDVSGGAMIKSTGTGTATGTFVGAEGTYWLDVTWINENDGAAQFTVLVNGIPVQSWTGAGGDTSGESVVERIAVSLDYGDVITLRGVKNAGEPARIDFITISDKTGNTDPTADDDSFATDMDTPLIISAPGILANDSDLDGDTLTVGSITGGVTNGVLVSNPDGSFTYTPDTGFTGEDSFTYEVSDGNGGTAEATVTITVEDPNAIEGALIGVGETEAESLDLGGAYIVESSTDPEISGGAWIKSTGTGTATGTFVGEDGTYSLNVYWINENDGAAQFTVLVNNVAISTWTGAGGDTSGERVVQQIPVTLEFGDVITLRGVKNGGEPARIDMISIGAGNALPVADDSSGAGDEDTAITGTVTASDPDADTLTFSKASDPSNGSVVVNGDGSYTYTPDADFNGTDSFTFLVSDGNGGTDTGTVTITVDPVGDDPIAQSGSVSGDEDTVIAGSVIATDADGDSLTYSKASDPTSGSVVVNPDGSYEYTPDPDFFGTDSFTYLVEDSTGAEDVATVTVTVDPVNDDPIADDLSAEGDEDTVISGTVTASDIDGGTLTFALDSGPANGSVVVNPDGTFDYTPDVDFSGEDSFDVEVTDGNGGSDISTVTVTVDPTAFGEISLGTTEAEDLLLSGGYSYEAITHRDVPSGADIRAIGTGEAEGVFVSASGSYFIDVAWLNEHDGVSSFSLLINDEIIDTWTGIGGDPSVDREIKRIAVDLGTNDVITLRGTQGTGENARIDSILITEQSQNTAPIARADSYTAYENSTLNLSVPTLLANDEDLDGDTISVSGVTSDVSNGTLTVNPNGTFTYTPDTGFLGTDSFTYQVSDGNGGLAEAVATITVQEQSPPSGALIDVGVTEAETLDLNGYAVSVLPHADAPSGQGISTTGTGTATGSFVGASGAYWIDVAWMNESDGAAQFTVFVNNVQLAAWSGTGGSLAADREFERIGVNLNYGDVIKVQGVKQGGENAYVDTIIVTSQSDNANPFARADYYSATQGIPKNVTVDGVLANDEDLDGDTLVVSSVVSDVEHGNLSLNSDGTFTYTADAEYTGEDSFTYLVSDGNGGTATATATITVGELSAAIGVGETEAENLDLSGGYVVEDTPHANVPSGYVIGTTTSGTATGTFVGEAGLYWLDVTWMNEHDGAAEFAVLVNNEVVSFWTGTGGETAITMETHRIGVELQAGDTISLQGIRMTGENARFDKIALTARTPVYSALDPADYDYFAFAGQSNAGRHFERVAGDFSEGPMGFVAFEAAVEDQTGGMTTAINVASGGSGSNEQARSDLFWWNTTTDTPGQILLDAVADIQAAMGAGEDLDGIIWSQGETDAFAVDTAGTLSEQDAIDLMVEATTSVFEYFWSAFGEDVPIFIQELGNISIYDSIHGLRDAQAQMAADLDNVYMGALTTGYTLYDNLHFSVDVYGDIAEDLATTAVDTIMGDTILV